MRDALLTFAGLLARFFWFPHFVDGAKKRRSRAVIIILFRMLSHTLLPHSTLLFLPHIYYALWRPHLSVLAWTVGLYRPAASGRKQSV